MAKITFKKNDVYDGMDSYSDVKRTEEYLQLMKESVLNFERDLIDTYVKKPSDMYNSEYSFELGKFLSEKLSEAMIIESDRYKFWDMLRNYVNQQDDRLVITDKRDPYEYCYMLSKLDRSLVLKYSRARWDHLFDCVTARQDDRIYKWLLNNEEVSFLKSSDVWKEFIKGIKVYFKKIDTSIFDDEELFEFYDDIMYKSIYIIKYMKENSKFNSNQRDVFFEKSKKIKHTDIDSLKSIIDEYLTN